MACLSCWRSRWQTTTIAAGGRVALHRLDQTRQLQIGARNSRLEPDPLAVACHPTAQPKRNERLKRVSHLSVIARAEEFARRESPGCIAERWLFRVGRRSERRRLSGKCQGGASGRRR